MSVEVIHEETGPHEGWRRQQFRFEGHLYELMTIDREGEKTSHIRKLRDHSLGDHILGIGSVITPDDAHSLLIKFKSINDTAYAEGQRDLQRSIRKLLGLA